MDISTLLSKLLLEIQWNPPFTTSKNYGKKIRSSKWMESLKWREIYRGYEAKCEKMGFYKGESLNRGSTVTTAFHLDIHVYSMSSWLLSVQGGNFCLN